jgi:hypothetical protein
MFEVFWEIINGIDTNFEDGLGVGGTIPVIAESVEC